jgi:nucleotide-binding universal stress UspA family protein
VLAIICQATLAAWMVHMSWIAWIVAPAWITVGMVIYLTYSKPRALATADEIMVFEEQEAPKTDQYRVMVPVANPSNAVELVRNTYRICGAKDARVEVLHMVPVPDQVPLSDAGRYMLEGKEAILEAMLSLGPSFSVSTTLRYCRNIARGIVSAVRQKKVNMLIMGWHGRTSAQTFTLGSTVDPIIERAPCNVVLLKECGGNRQFNRVLVPLAGGPNGALALEVASILADED